MTFLKKLIKNRTVNERRTFVDPSHPLSMRRQCELLSVSRSTVYYKGVDESKKNLHLMATMDRLFTEYPTLGVLGMQDKLADMGIHYNIKRIRRLLRNMGVEPMYPKKNLSKLGIAKYVFPYLLRHLEITRPNQVWAIDITYIPMKCGRMYFSEIKSDQGSQYTCANWVKTLQELDIRISMDGKGHATDNAIIERWFRTLKQKYIYLNPLETGLSLFHGDRTFVYKYNQRRHQGINRKKPIELYHRAA